MSPSVSDVSVVTVNWNGKEHLEQLLPSLARLSAREIIVVDNGSTDGSQDFLSRHYPQVRILQNDTNRGFAAPNNRAADEAGGRFLAFVNNDMRVQENWLTAALARLTGQVACVGSRILDWNGERIDFNGSSLQYLGYALQKDMGELWRDVSSPDRLLFACGGALVIDREIFRRVGGFDEDYFAIYEDVDLGWRLWVAGYEVAFAPDSLTFHRGHGTFKAHANEKMRYLMHRNALMTIIKNYEEPAFRRLLPLAVLLTVKRAVTFSGVQKEHFYLWSNIRERLKTSEPSALFSVLDALNQLVALDDVLTNLPVLLEKRQKVQSLRRRPDAEIFRLFVDPFRTIVENPDYLEAESEYLSLLDLAGLFRPHAGLSPLPDRAAVLEQRVEGLRRELNALQWNQSLAATRQPGASNGSIAHFWNVWRRSGFAVAWRRFMERVDRGL